ncbi:unnamed protein product, partial [Tenebrio molitor]
MVTFRLTRLSNVISISNFVIEYDLNLNMNNFLNCSVMKC